MTSADASRFVVIGAGLAGAASAWRLAQQGHEVTVLERSTPANHEGSSHGSARIFRYAYPDPFYARLVADSRAEWDELERAAGTTLVTRTGALDGGNRRDPVGLARVLEAAGVEHEVVPEREARERWPGLLFSGEILWHPDAGVIDAQRSVEAMLALAVEAGARILLEWDVAGIVREEGAYRLRSTRGDLLDAEGVVVAAGGWLPGLLPDLGLPAAAVSSLPPLHVRQEQAFHFPYREPYSWPTFIYKSDQIQVYGLPGGRDAEGRGHKVAEYNGGRILRSAADQDGLVSPANRARVTRFVGDALPGLIPEPYAETTCLFTNTPDEDFIIDRIDGITVLSPCSGHGAKFAPLLGTLAAELATARNPDESRVPRRFRPVSTTARGRERVR